MNENERIILAILSGKAKDVFAELERLAKLERTFGRLVHKTELFEYSIN